jgi:hypothetical protein
MVTITEGVDFDTIAREWRCKWSGDNDKKSLAEAQKALNAVLADIKAVDGFGTVNRVVCGGCLDFKVCTLCTAASLGERQQIGGSSRDKGNRKLIILHNNSFFTGDYIASCWRQVCCLGGR